MEISKSYRAELERRHSFMERADYRPEIKIVKEYEYKNFKLGQKIKIKISVDSAAMSRKFSGSEAIIVGFDITTKGSKFIAVELVDCPEEFNGGKPLKGSRMVDIILKGHEDSKILWIDSIKDIITKEDK